MKNKIILSFLLVFLFFSCTKDEEELASLLESIRSTKNEFYELGDLSILNDKGFILLKSYSDSLHSGSELLNSLMHKKSSVKKIRK